MKRSIPCGKSAGAVTAQWRNLPERWRRFCRIALYFGNKGKVTLVNSWATRCVTCAAEMPMLTDLHRLIERLRTDI